MQCYLEVLSGTKKILLATFGGEGTSVEAAHDDAAWQALEFLYIFCGFVLAEKVEGNKLEESCADIEEPKK